MDRHERRILASCLEPRNIGLLEDADGVGRVGDVTDKQFVVFFIGVDDGRLVDVRYLLRGDCSSIAACSALSELAMNRPLAEAEAISALDVTQEMDADCCPGAADPACETAVTALRRAIADYHRRGET